MINNKLHHNHHKVMINNKLHHNHHKVMTNNKEVIHGIKVIKVIKVVIHGIKVIKVVIHGIKVTKVVIHGIKVINGIKVVIHGIKVINGIKVLIGVLHKMLQLHKTLLLVVTALPFGVNVVDKVSMVQLAVLKVLVNKLVNISTNAKIKLIKIFSLKKRIFYFFEKLKS